jgi:hypothetical protein
VQISLEAGFVLWRQVRRDPLQRGADVVNTLIIHPLRVAVLVAKELMTRFSKIHFFRLSAHCGFTAYFIGKHLIRFVINFVWVDLKEKVFLPK